MVRLMVDQLAEELAARHLASEHGDLFGHLLVRPLRFGLVRLGDLFILRRDVRDSVGRRGAALRSRYLQPRDQAERSRRPGQMPSQPVQRIVSLDDCGFFFSSVIALNTASVPAAEADQSCRKSSVVRYIGMFPPQSK